MKKIFKKILIYIRPFLNWKFLISYFIPYMLIVGWVFIAMIIGKTFEIKWLFNLGISYYVFLWTPFATEKVITIPIAIWLHTKIFGKKDEKTRLQLENMYEEAKKDLNKLKNIFKKEKK